MSDTMRAVQVAAPGDPFELVEVPVPDPGPAEVRVEVAACGVCHSDSYAKTGDFPGISYPRIPGHEIVGHVDAIGADVESFAPGDRVGAGWHAGHCFTCEACRRGDFQQCANEEVHGVTVDGGYAEYVTIGVEALASVPADLDSVSAAPLLCAGVTTFNALRNATTRPGDLVAVQGIGGLGHLGVQYARHSGFETVAISSSDDKKERTEELGADRYVDASSTDPAEALQEHGGADVILATAPDADSITSILPGLASDGELVLLGVPGDPIDVPGDVLVGNRASIRGWSTGHARDSQDALEFSALRDIAPDVERFDLSEAATAYDRMMASDVRFRAVLEP